MAAMPYGDLSQPPAPIDQSVEVRDSADVAQQPEPAPEPEHAGGHGHGHGHAETGSHGHGHGHGHSHGESVGGGCQTFPCCCSITLCENQGREIAGPMLCVC